MDDVITFSEGLIGLKEYQQFIIKSIPEQEAFLLLQSTEDENFGLIITPPFWFKRDYEFELSDHYVEQLGDKESLEVFVVVTLADLPQAVTANLLGPLVMNRKKGIGFQVLVPDRGYTTKYKLLSEASVGG
ncbi:flagellar assembly factor FliW [Sporomusaceae bacterium BoRhaA]|uniref:flagellar assembly protein FliW n=1 Tax=Pelorhabdus rhamnosifermentans TaxID=2772457 RepID=UPI001C05F05E|nr:flagellar assembly protein FliW [Pelorhabdus rhamnosifermentans]MBU2699148.1 flagellar assembly factor FliW [Pelorhabdus rhamnosifermentans]